MQSKLSDKKKKELFSLLEKYADYSEYPDFFEGTFAFMDTDEDIDKLIEYIKENPGIEEWRITIFCLELDLKKQQTK